jgi:hypothetical protein
LRHVAQDLRHSFRKIRRDAGFHHVCDSHRRTVANLPVSEAFQDAQKDTPLTVFQRIARLLIFNWWRVIDQLLSQQPNDSLIDPDPAISHKSDGLHQAIRTFGIQEDARCAKFQRDR